MSAYCKCFFSNKKKYLLEKKQKSDTLLYYYDKLHNDHNNSVRTFSQTEYNNTMCEVNKLKQKLLGK